MGTDKAFSDILIFGPSMLQYRCKMTNKCVKELMDFINVFQLLPRHVSASCHLQGGYGDYDPYTPTTQTLLD
jgi:hypothetical protein